MSALPSTLNLNGYLMTVSGGTIVYGPPAVVNANQVAQSYELALTTSPVEVVLPSNTTWFGVTPPIGNAVVISHKWQIGDTGGPVSPTYGIPCMAVGTQLTFYLWAASAVTVTIWSA